MDGEILSNLSAAVSNGRTDIVRTLINIYENGGDSENRTKHSCEKLLREVCNPSGTLLHLATKLDHVDIVRTLLSSGADPTIQNSLGETPFDFVQSQRMTAVYVDELLKCSAKSETDHIRQLVDAGVDVNGEDSPESGNRALHWAVCFGKPEAVQCLLDLGASPNVINGQGATPLHDAVQRKNTEIIKILLAAGANPAFKSYKGKYMGKTPLHLAEGNDEITNILLEYAKYDTSSDKNGSSKYAEMNSDSSIVNDHLSESLQSLSTSSDTSVHQNSVVTATQPLQVPPFLLTPLPLITDSKLHLLWPQPQNIIQTDGKFFKIEEMYSVQIVDDCTEVLYPIIDLWHLHCKLFETFGIECQIEDIHMAGGVCDGDIICCMNSQQFSRKESYKLIIADEQIRIIFSDLHGLHYALCSLGQLFSLYHEDGLVPSLFIHDWPQLQHRAVLLDLSRGARKPNLETLKSYIQTMSYLKLRQLHCFFRFELLGDDSLPYPNKSLIEISRHCNKYLIDIVPVFEVEICVKYCDIKEASESIRHLISLFSAKSIQVGPNLSSLLFQELLSSKNPRVIWDVLMLPSSTAIFLGCGNMQHTSELLSLLPMNCVLIDYDYKAEHDYDCNAKLLTLAGFSVCIGTGTASWGSIAGCPELAISCIHKASIAASQHGSYGLVVADWKTVPHHAAFCFSWPGIVLGLGMAWNCTVHEDYLHARLPELLNNYVYRDSGQVVGYLNVELGRLEAFLHRSVFQNKNDLGSSVLHQLLVDPDGVSLDNFTFDLIQQVIRHVKKFELELQKAKPTCYQQGEYISELRLAMDLLLFASRMCKVMISTGVNPTGNSCGLAVINVGISNLPPIARTDLANRLLALTEQFRAVWLSRNLPCGLQTSLCILNGLLHKLIPENSHSLYSINGNLNTKESYE